MISDERSMMSVLDSSVKKPIVKPKRSGDVKTLCADFSIWKKMKPDVAMTKISDVVTRKQTSITSKMPSSRLKTRSRIDVMLLKTMPLAESKIWKPR